MLASSVALAVAVSSSAAADGGHEQTQDAMDAVVRRGDAPGLLGQAEDGGGVWHGEAGVADRESGRPRLPGERFRIGSITKTFVATVLLQLEAERKVKLDDAVEKWLPGLVRGQGHNGRRITLRQLLNHTSGIYDFTVAPAFRRQLFGPAFLDRRYDRHAPAELVRAAMAHPPDFPPGTGWRYSNTNYVLAGLVVEVVTGRPYAEEIRNRVIDPLGLRDTSLPGESTGIPGRHGRAYSSLPGDTRTEGSRTEGSRTDADGTRTVHDVTALNPAIAGASGEMISSTGDLITFLRALLDGRLLPPRQLRAMTTTVPTADTTPYERYGLGLRARELSCGTVVWGHDGTIHGSAALAMATRDTAHSAAFHANGDWSVTEDELLEAEFCG
ncbi:class A beta-lactamase-related serine hydrolase [Streptomyces armeniacus]|uniref:Class A beta-lactamase-related serine hydrolase n=1 Tax=Streptomyces armeniacus TaxID=83291 RepID=A0A345Y114_9ACTN|nr:class A beta-lactamase-related serine hydrolase [Streptomyces armeniacus]